MKAILGKKLGMTQIFDPAGNAVPVTVLQVGPCPVIQRKSDAKPKNGKNSDGYHAVQLGFEEIPGKRATKIVNKPRRGHFEKNGAAAVHRYLKEVRVEDSTKVPDVITASIFEGVNKVDVIGTSKGKGFQGTIKRHGFGGGPASHGSKVHRRPCSNGSTDAQRTFKGKKRPGQMGNARVTALGLALVRVDNERNIILVKGSVPGPNGRLVTVRASSH